MDIENKEVQEALSKIPPGLREATEAKLAEPDAERPEADNPAHAAVIDAAFRAEADRLLEPVHPARRLARHIGERLIK